MHRGMVVYIRVTWGVNIRGKEGMERYISKRSNFIILGIATS